MSIAHDLSDAEFNELDDLLEATPEPLQALDASMLDGYLCGVLVQPRLIPVEEWLPPIFDYEGGSLPADVDPAWLARLRSLVERRFAALNQSMLEQGWFYPLVLDLEAEGEGDAEAVVGESPARFREVQLAGLGHAVAEHEGIVGGLDQQGGDADRTEEVAAGGAAVVVVGVGVAMQRRGDLAVEIPESAHAVQRPQLFQNAQVLTGAGGGEATLLGLHVGRQFAHKVRLIHAGKAQADAIGAVVQAKRH